MSLTYVPEDWTRFRQISTLCQMAGVTEDRLQRTVVKELVDNALDAVGSCKLGWMAGGGIFVEDAGPGIPPEKVAELFSIRRPLTSSKLNRLPTRGALGNGLRVVVGAISASGGSLVVETGGKRLSLLPQDDGHTEVIEEPSNRTTGVRVELTFGPTMPPDENPIGWGDLAIMLAGTSPIYTGKTSPHWEDADAFFERCQAAGDATVRELMAEFDGCSGKKAGEIAASFNSLLKNPEG